MKKYIVFGGGGFLSDIFDLIHANEGTVYKIYQNIEERVSAGDLSLRERVALLGYPVEVHDSLGAFIPEEGCSYVVGFLHEHKYVLVEELRAKFKISFSRLIHPQINVGSNVHFGEGVIINAGTIIAPNTFLDDCCSLNRATVIGHDVRIGKFTRVGPAVVLAGRACIGDKCSIGMSASILERVTIGDWTVIGAGALVTKDMPEKVVAYGVPAKVICHSDRFRVADHAILRRRAG